LSDDVVTAQNIKRYYTEILDSKPFAPDPQYSWRWACDVYTLKSGTGNEDFVIDGNLITLPGKNIKGRKVVSKVIDINHPNVGGKTLEIIGSIRAVLPVGKESSFNIHARILDANNKIIKCDGFTYTKNCYFGYRGTFVNVPKEGKRLQLVISGVNFDENSIGEARNLFIFER
jgi:hypothetical protein